MTDDLQSWSEVPRIAHFCSLFRKAFNLLEFDIQDLEEGLLLLEDEERLVPQLLVKLLKGCSRTFSKVTQENYNKYLRRLFISKAEEAEEDEIEYYFECEEFTERGIDFEDLSLRDRVRVLHQLCEFRLDGEDVSDKVKNLEASSLRVEPLGKDSEGYTYWYFYGTRLYKEAGSGSSGSLLSSSEERKRRKDKEKKKRKKKEKKKKKKRNSHSSSEDESSSVPESGVSSSPPWSVACLTLQDWIDLTDKVHHSKKKVDKELYLTLSDNFLPEIIKMFADKEREERRRLRLLAPKRSSSRIEHKRAEQEEKDRILAEKLEDEDFGESLGRRRGRSRKLVDDLVVEKNRSDRLREREQLKELRDTKNAETEVVNTFPSEVETQRRQHPGGGRKSSAKDLSDEDEDEPILSKKNHKASRKYSKDEDDDESQNDERTLRNSKKGRSGGSRSPPRKSEDSRRRKRRRHRRPSSSKSKKKHKSSDSSSNEDDPNDESYSETSEEEETVQSESSGDEDKLNAKEVEEETEEEEEDRSSPKAKASTFANALLKVGTKSTRDSTLDKSIRKSPGRLLQTAGLQKSGSISSSKMVNGVDRLNGGGNTSGPQTTAHHLHLEGGSNGDEDLDDEDEPKISFSLYGGHLPVDIGGSVGFPKCPGELSPGESRLLGGLSSSGSKKKEVEEEEEPESPVRKVFSNWGGEFFKKNLDYRANTNKILEKMNLSPAGGSAPASVASSPAQRKEFLSPFKKNAATGAVPSSSSNNNTPPSSDEKKPLKPFLGYS